ncbi:MAG: hypothetical protein WC517_03390, partial [Patescibacteria group bacterium]
MIFSSLFLWYDTVKVRYCLLNLYAIIIKVSNINDMLKATLHTDGGARGNPGPAGIGAVLKILASAEIG